MSEMFVRPNGERVTLEEVARIVATYMAARPMSSYTVTVGTDSQNYDKTKMVEVIALHRVGSGGIFFYRVNYIRRIANLRQKIQEETQRSLQVADVLFADVEAQLAELGVDLNDMDIHFQIHCDVGYHGSTKALIQEIVGWVQSLGYECCIKPNSYAASAVADKYSK